MKHLVVGAGATLAEAIEQKAPRELWPPVIRDFARKTWADYAPSPMLDHYLKTKGLYEPRDDLRELFYELEAAEKTDIERYMAFAWTHRDVELAVGAPMPAGYISGLRISHGDATPQPNGHWENLLYHGIGRPLADAQMNCFYEHGRGFRSLTTTQQVARRFGPGDFVLNLNYDTVFEIGLGQLGRAFAYAPNRAAPGDLIVCKPHGSLNMVSNDHGFMFGDPTLVYFIPPPGFLSFSGLVPPRLGKHYAEHPIAEAILAGAAARRPKSLTFWGIGLTDSDTDLLDLYQGWASSAAVIEVINPAPEVACKARTLFTPPVVSFRSVEEWLAAS
jgi:hypothetical protein